jgi:magnesium-transporting ATPase (P-type)
MTVWFSSYTEKGYRVIAMGKRDMDKSVKITKIQRMERDEAEMDLEFLGLIIMENR